MTSLNELYDKLEIYSKNFNDWDSIEKFSKIAREIVSYGDINSFPILLKYFDDNDDTDFVLEDLSDAIEGYDGEKYIKGILQNLSIMFPKAKIWARGLIVVCLNSPEDLEILKANLHLAEKEKLLEILDMIYQRTEKHRPVIEELRNLIEKGDK